MESTFAHEIDNSGTAVPFFSVPAGEKGLVVAARNGIEDAFEILVELYRRMMRAVVLRLTRVQKDAEDITQQSFQKTSVRSKLNLKAAGAVSTPKRIWHS